MNRDDTTLAEAIERSIDAAEAAAFWTEVARRMSSQPSDDGEKLSAGLRDGLNPAESWEDVW